LLKYRKKELIHQEKKRIFERTKTSKEIREKQGYEFNSVEKSNPSNLPLNSLEVLKTNSEIENSDDHSKSIEMERLSNFDEFQKYCNSWGNSINGIKKKMKYINSLDLDMRDILKEDMKEIEDLGMNINNSYQRILDTNRTPTKGDNQNLVNYCGILRRISASVYLGIEEFYEGSRPYSKLKETISNVNSSLFTKFDIYNVPDSIEQNNNFFENNSDVNYNKSSSQEKDIFDNPSSEYNSEDHKRKLKALDTIVEESVEFDSKRQSKISARYKQDVISEYNMASQNNLSNVEKKLGFDDFQSFNENVSVGGSHASGVFHEGKSQTFNFSSDIDIKK
jgi:hypothetical protein